MFVKQKKGEDSLLLLQRDLNQLAFAHYQKVKEAKNNAKRKIENKKKKIEEEEGYKFPSLYQSPNSKNKLNSLNNHHSSLLLQKIQQFQNRINDLQTENSIHKRQNEKLIDDIIKLRSNNKSLYENYQSPPSLPVPYHQQMPYSPPPFMPNLMNPYQNFQPMGINPYMNPMQMPNSFEKQKSKLYGKPNKKLKNVNKFRVAGYAIFFSIYFPKYAKSFTINRFDDFKENWKQDSAIEEARQNMKQYLLENVSFNIFQTINELDQYKQADDDEQQSNPKKNKSKSKGKGKTKKKAQSSDDDSDSDSDQQSQSSRSQQKSDVKEKQQKNKGDQKVFQFYLKLDVSVNFIVEFIKQITKTISSQQFVQKNQYLILFLSRQFQSDMLNEQSDFKYINFHPTKGYSQHQRIVTEYLLIKNILLDIFVQGQALNEFGKKYFLTDSANQQLQNRVFFSFFIRTTLMKKMINEYASKKIQKAKTFSLPKEQLLPFPKVWNNTNPLEEGVITFENNGLKMDQNSIHQISAAEVKKKEKEMRNLLDQFCEKLYRNLIIMRRKKYVQISNKTVNQKYRTQQTNYFILHQKGQRQKLMQSIFTKTSKTQFQKTQKSIVNKKSNGEIKRKEMNKNKNKNANTNDKPNKKAPKVEGKKKIKSKRNKSSDESSSSQED